MITSVDEWVSFLRNTDKLIGLPLIVSGAMLMLLGWRFWKPCVAMAYFVVGTILATRYFGTERVELIYAIPVGLATAYISYVYARYAAALLAGLLAAGLVLQMMDGLRIQGFAYWIIGSTACFCGSACGFINRRLVIIFVTAVMGAVLLISGLTCLVMASPSLYGTMRSMTSGSSFVMTFLLLVPTVMSSLFQVSEVHRNQVEL